MRSLQLQSADLVVSLHSVGKASQRPEYGAEATAGESVRKAESWGIGRQGGALEIFSHPLPLWGIKGHSTWGPTDRERDLGCQPTPQSSAQYSGLWDALPIPGKENTKSALCICNERMGDKCSSCHPRIQSPDFWFASPCIAGEKAKESFYSSRKFGRRASEQSSNPESGSPERALGEHVSTLQRVDHRGWSKSSIGGESADGGWKKCSIDGESAERVSA